MLKVIENRLITYANKNNSMPAQTRAVYQFKYVHVMVFGLSNIFILYISLKMVSTLIIGQQIVLHEEYENHLEEGMLHIVQLNFTREEFEPQSFYCTLQAVNKVKNKKKNNEIL